MAKYNWQQLETEYILSNHNTVTSFLKEKGIPNNGSTKKRTAGWKSKKVLKEDRKSTKTIEKVLEKESEKSANEIVKVKDVANTLLIELSKMATSLNNPECKVDIKRLTSALKDLNDVFGGKPEDSVQRVQIINDLPGDDNET